MILTENSLNTFLIGQLELAIKDLKTFNWNMIVRDYWKVTVNQTKLDC